MTSLAPVVENRQGAKNSLAVLKKEKVRETNAQQVGKQIRIDTQ